MVGSSSRPRLTCKVNPVLCYFALFSVFGRDSSCSGDEHRCGFLASNFYLAQRWVAYLTVLLPTPYSSYPPYMMQTSIRPAEKGKLGDKLQWCARCETKPKMGEKWFLICSACETTVYCSNTCQKAAWTSHKPQCEDRQRSNNNTAIQDGAYAAAEALVHELIPGYNIPNPVPSHGERVRLFHHFRHSHIWSFQRAIAFSVLLRGGPKNFDFANHCIIFDVRYRLGCGGNPSLAYSILNANIRPLSGYFAENPAVQTLIKANKLVLDDVVTLRSKTVPGFAGFFPSIYHWEDYGGYIISHPTPIHHDPELELRVPYMRACHEWKKDLQRATEAGIIYQRGKGGGWQAGHFGNVHGRWTHPGLIYAFPYYSMCCFL